MLFIMLSLPILCLNAICMMATVLKFCRDICHHKEAYVRRAVLFTASCILVSLHPSSIASSLAEGSVEISRGLEWVRSWALHVAESDTDRECYTVSEGFLFIKNPVFFFLDCHKNPDFGIFSHLLIFLL